jgi:hypothetical protein
VGTRRTGYPASGCGVASGVAGGSSGRQLVTLVGTCLYSEEAGCILQSPANRPMASAHLDVYGHMCGRRAAAGGRNRDWLGRECSSLLCEGVEPKYFFTKACRWLDSKLARLAGYTSFYKTVHQPDCIASSVSNHLDFQCLVSKQHIKGLGYGAQ